MNSHVYLHFESDQNCSFNGKFEPPSNNDSLLLSQGLYGSNLECLMKIPMKTNNSLLE
jgi:hypothetical protein